MAEVQARALLAVIMDTRLSYFILFSLDDVFPLLCDTSEYASCGPENDGHPSKCFAVEV